MYGNKRGGRIFDGLACVLGCVYNDNSQASLRHSCHSRSLSTMSTNVSEYANDTFDLGERRDSGLMVPWLLQVEMVYRKPAYRTNIVLMLQTYLDMTETKKQSFQICKRPCRTDMLPIMMMVPLEFWYRNPFFRNRRTHLLGAHLGCTGACVNRQ